MFLLDTDHISILQDPSQPEAVPLSRRMAAFSPGDFYFAVVSFHEQMLGAHAYLNRARLGRDLVKGYRLCNELLGLYSSAQVLPFDLSAAAELDNLRGKKVRIGTIDLRIAAVAMSRNLTVLTRNLRDFQKVPGLVVEDWTI
jgi:tRNA(fMet)-specific endonuclease VapC